MQEIKDSIGFQIVQICRTHRQQAETALNKIGLHAGQEMILLRLWSEEGITQSQLAERMGVEPPTVTKMLDRMKGLVERRQDGGDARVSRVYLTEQGRELIGPITELWKQLEERTLAGLTLPEQMLLRRLLLQIYTNIHDGENCP